jgi:phosphinothricin acetyltransferase
MKFVEMQVVTVRALLPTDWTRVSEIYKSGIATGIATFETQVPEWELWDKNHFQFARIVATKNNHVIGWTALSPVSSRCVYGGVAEISVYIDENHRGQGIGNTLLKNLITQSEENSIWTLQAGIFTENIASIKLHESLGFRIVGYRERIGKLKNTWKDNFILERRSEKVGID